MALTNGTDDHIRKILLLGDNNTSSSIVKALSKEDFEIHVTSTSDATQRIAAETYHTCDLTADSLRAVFSDVGPDVVVSTVAGGSCETQKRIINCALGTSVTRFIPCEFGQDSLNDQIQERLPPSRERAKIIKHLEELASRGYISWVGIAIGTVLDRGILNGNLGFDLKWQSATVHGKGSEQFAASSAAWVGRVVLAALRHWEDVKNQYLYAAGFVTSANELIEGLQEETGQTWVSGRSELEDCVHEAERRIERGFPDAGMFLMERSLLYDESLEAAKPFVDKDAKTKLGLGGEKLEDIVKHVVHDHQHHGGKADCGCG